MMRIILGLIISIIVLILWPRYIKLNAFFSLIFAALLFAVIAGMQLSTTIFTMQSGFGSLLQQIGIVVALGAVLGTLLEKTGATEVISTALLQMFGARRSVLAISFIGAIVGIPVFCDSGFIILSKLIPALALKTSANQTSLVLALSSSLYTTHTLVPPTPGPLAAAANLGLEDQLGSVILVGLLASVPVVAVSYFYAKRIGAKISGPVTPVQEVKVQKPINAVRAFLPLIMPILLIAISSFGGLVVKNSLMMDVFSFLGIPIIALLVGILLALTLIDRSIHPDWTKWATDGLKSAGIILVIIGAGGAFGAVIKSSGLNQMITHIAADERLNGILFILFAWCIGAIFKIAQGSTTSSMIITSSLMAPLAAASGLHSSIEMCILVVAIGGGAMTVSHANDAYFWVVSEFGGVSERDLFRTYTPMTLVQGLTTLLTAIILFLIL